MTLARRTRDAARDEPFLVDALRAGVVNYSAAARYLGVDGDDEAVATALRRFADDLPDIDATERDVRVRMERGIGVVDAEDASAGDALLSVSGTAFGSAADGRTAIVATGAVDLDATRAVVGALAVVDVAVDALAYADDALVVVVPRLDAANALRAVEDALETVPTGPGETDR